jgi:hypothetical protein
MARQTKSANSLAPQRFAAVEATDAVMDALDRSRLTLT